MFPRCRVAVVAATLLIAVSGWVGASFWFVPQTPEVFDSAAPAPPPTTTTVWVVDPFIIEPLDADRHASEVSIPPMASLPPGITLSTTTTTLPGIDDARCGEWWSLAIEVGWTVDDLATLDRIMWRESRCIADVVSPTRDYGLVQVNRAVWRDFVEARGYVMDDLLDPRIGLMFGLLIAHEAEAIGWCRWAPWYMSGDYCA
jgi:hypothetical protein